MTRKLFPKQIRLTKQQNLWLKRLAKERGVSESEVVRQALARDEKEINPVIRKNSKGWEDIQRFVKERQSISAG